MRITGAAAMTVLLSRTSPRPPMHRIVHRSELAAVHRPSVTVVRQGCGHHTAQGEIWQASVPGRNAEMRGTSEKAAAKQSRSKPATILTNNPRKADQMAIAPRSVVFLRSIFLAK